MTWTESPDCRDGNHHKCDGTAWDLSLDAPAICQCGHHQDPPAVRPEDIKWPEEPGAYRRAKAIPPAPYTWTDPVQVDEVMAGLAGSLMERVVRERVRQEETAMVTMLSVIMDQLGIRQLILTPEEFASVRPGVDIVRDLQGDQVIINRHQLDKPEEGHDVTPLADHEDGFRYKCTVCGQPVRYPEELGKWVHE